MPASVLCNMALSDAKKSAIAKEWLSLLVEKRPVDGLEGLSIGQLNTLAISLLEASDTLLDSEHSQDHPGGETGTDDLVVEPLSNLESDDEGAEAVKVGLKQLVERHIWSYDRFDHPFSLLQVALGAKDEEGPKTFPTLPRDALASRLEDVVRRVDWVLASNRSIYVLLPETGREQCSCAQDRFTAALDDRQISALPPGTQLSIASAVCPDDSVDADELISLAESRLKPFKFRDSGTVPARPHLRLTA